FSLFIAGLLFYFDFYLAVFSLILILLFTFYCIWAGLIYLNGQKKMLVQKGKLSSLLHQFMIGIEKIKVSSSKRRAFVAWARLFKKYRSLSLRSYEIKDGIHFTIIVFRLFSLVLLFGIAGYFRGLTLATGNFIAFFVAFDALFQNTAELADAYFTILEAVPVFKSSDVIYKTIPEKEDLKTTVDTFQGNIEVNNIFFRYSTDSPIIIDDLSFRLEPNEFVAFVGPSGSGKSTLVRLLLGFEKPDSGSIYYDGYNLDKLDLQSVRRQIGSVLQNSMLLPGSIYSNISGARNLTIEDIWEAIIQAGLEEEISDLPMGLETVITEGGSTFSGGQKQRLLIARALVTRPRILFFDEATSALDNYTQSVIINNLENLRATRIVIAHRLSTIRNADRIYVVDKGKIVQCGSYEKLIREEGLFKNYLARN
ncbi:ATP-binding cassette domain-containing protein, partial [Candidatus Margulisiibacteriota bacterium]